MCCLAAPAPKVDEKAIEKRIRAKLEKGFDARAAVRAEEILRTRGDQRIKEAERKIAAADKAMKAARFKVTEDEFKLLKKVFAPNRTLEQDTALAAKAILDRIEPLVQRRGTAAPFLTAEDFRNGEIKQQADRIKSGKGIKPNWGKGHKPSGDAFWYAECAGHKMQIEETEDDDLAIWVGSWNERRKYTVTEAKQLAKEKLIETVTA